MVGLVFLRRSEVDSIQLGGGGGGQNVLIFPNGILLTKVKLDLLTDIDMLLIIEKVLEEGYVMLFIDM